MPLARLEPFYKEMFAVCKNGMIPRKALKLALIQVDSERFNGVRTHRWRFANRSLEDAADDLGATIRRGASKLRALKKDVRLYKNAMIGASDITRTLIDKIMTYMVIERVPPKDCTIVDNAGGIVDNCGCKMDIFYKFLATTTTTTTTTTNGMTSEVPSHDVRISHDPKTPGRSSRIVSNRLFTMPSSSLAQIMHEHRPLNVELVPTIDPPRPRPPMHMKVPVRTRRFAAGVRKSSVKQRGKDPRRRFMCRAYQAAFRKAQQEGYDATTSRSFAKNAYKVAREQFVDVD